MKVFISADIEGIAGIAHSREVQRDKPDYHYFQKAMTREVNAAVEGAIAAGAQEVWVRDAHGSARNILFDELPEDIRIVRGWTGHPYTMMDGIDSSFAAALFVGYHSGTQSDGNALAHTMSSRCLTLLNGKATTEFDWNAMTAAHEKVPAVFISGDEALCRHSQEALPGITTVSTLEGFGSGCVSRHPRVVEEDIRQSVERCIRNRSAHRLYPLPSQFKLEFRFQRAENAYARSFFPGVKKLSGNTLEYSTTHYLDALMMMNLMTVWQSIGGAHD